MYLFRWYCERLCLGSSKIDKIKLFDVQKYIIH